MEATFKDQGHGSKFKVTCKFTEGNTFSAMHICYEAIQRYSQLKIRRQLKTVNKHQSGQCGLKRRLV